MKQNSLFPRGLSLLLALSVLLALAACGSRGGTAASMHLRRAEGTVDVSNGDGKSLPVLDNLNLYSGYGIGTRSASYAWIDLDDVKLTKLDQNSEIAIEQAGKALDIEVKSGSLFFNVTEPLENDETLNIRTSTMLVGIRGTCGWVEANGGLSRVYLLEGKVDCSAEGQTVRVNAGEMAELTADGELTVREFTEQDVPAFVRDEVDEDPGPDGSEPLEPSAPPETALIPQGVVVASGAAGENVTWDLYSDGTMVIGGTGPMEDYEQMPTPWLRNRDNITTVVIEDGVTNIGTHAFQGCSSLTSVTIGNSVTSIGKQTFFQCSNLISVTIPDSVTSIGTRAFRGCSSLTSITIPDSVTNIGDEVFCDCNGLTSATIGSGITSIVWSTFNSCSNLTSVTIPTSVISIGNSAFLQCNNLTDVYYGGSESQWGQIDIALGNDDLRYADIHYTG